MPAHPARMDLAIHQAASVVVGSVRSKKRKKKRGSSRRRRRDAPQEEGHAQGDDAHAHADKGGVYDLSGMNRLVEDISSDRRGDLPPGIWDEWLWRSNPNDPPSADALLNRCQSLGLLICRYRAARQPAWSASISLSPSRLIVVPNRQPRHMTLREVRDTVNNLMILWGSDVHANGGEEGGRSGLLLYLDACFHRLGELAWATWPCGQADSPISDDVGSIERVNRVVVRGGQRATEEHDQVSLSCLRTLINCFMMAYRLVHWMRVSSHGPTGQGGGGEDGLPACASIHQHHVNASLDDFYRISMYYDLPPAARLNYRHMFSGLYNCISQPVYYHNPDYERRMQAPLKDIQECRSDICTLPILMQIYPEVSVIYDDDDLGAELPQSVAALAPTERTYAFRWIVSACRVYLLRWNPKDRTQVVYREPDGNIIRCLRRHYLTHRVDHQEAQPAQVPSLLLQ